MTERRARKKQRAWQANDEQLASLPNLVSHPSPPCCLCLTGSRVTVVTRWAALRRVLHPRKLFTRAGPHPRVNANIFRTSSFTVPFFANPASSYVKLKGNSLSLAELQARLHGWPTYRILLFKKNVILFVYFIHLWQWGEGADIYQINQCQVFLFWQAFFFF